MGHPAGADAQQPAQRCAIGMIIAQCMGISTTRPPAFTVSRPRIEDCLAFTPKDNHSDSHWPRERFVGPCKGALTHDCRIRGHGASLYSVTMETHSYA
ncbi:hypothetical protein GDO78_014972 [Eleutherodactylus coqui]|uniref:Uncharacterized protein n=1 Tax=Eleutherodactylus coqui TaxID=57060 RepID=A0A8J6BEF8_ELECQ|nr:hypothetical protein GDO78_014972 [Eleutherodactylus coqui]